MGMFLTCFYPSGLVPVLRCWDLHLSTFGCNWDVERRGTRTQMAQKMVGLCEVGELVYVDLGQPGFMMINGGCIHRQTDQGGYKPTWVQEEAFSWARDILWPILSSLLPQVLSLYSHH